MPVDTVLVRAVNLAAGGAGTGRGRDHRDRRRDDAAVTPAGYSGTPLPRKLGIKEGARVAVVSAPHGFDETLGKLPDGVQVRTQARGRLDVLVFFVTRQAELARRFPAFVRALEYDGGLWVAWPKKTSGVATDLVFERVQEVGLAAGSSTTRSRRSTTRGRACGSCTASPTARRGAAEADANGRLVLRAALHRSPRVAGRAGTPPLRARWLRRHRDPVLALLPAGGELRGVDSCTTSKVEVVAATRRHGRRPIRSAATSLMRSRPARRSWCRTRGTTARTRPISTAGSITTAPTSPSREYSQVVAESVYGAAPHHGYIYGGSGGAGRTIACLEHAPEGLYDGAVVYILPHVAQQVLCAYVAETARVLGDALPSVVDATAPGGSGDPFAGLTAEQRTALATLYKLGFPRGAEDQIHPVTIARQRRRAGPARPRPRLLRRLLDRTRLRGHGDSVRASRIEREHTVVRLLTAGEIAGNAAIIDAMDAVPVPLGRRRRAGAPRCGDRCRARWADAARRGGGNPDGADRRGRGPRAVEPRRW